MHARRRPRAQWQQAKAIVSIDSGIGRYCVGIVKYAEYTSQPLFHVGELDELSFATHKLLQDEIDFEIALRSRLAETLQQRIEWASTLREQLDDRPSGMLSRTIRPTSPSSTDWFHYRQCSCG